MNTGKIAIATGGDSGDGTSTRSLIQIKIRFMRGCLYYESISARRYIPRSIAASSTFAKPSTHPFRSLSKQ